MRKANKWTKEIVKYAALRDAIVKIYGKCKQCNGKLTEY